MSEELQIAAAWLAAGHKVALGTVIRTWGSAPRPAGSQIAVRDDGAFLGSVSGGCVEGAVIEAALGAIIDAKSRELEFGVTRRRGLERRIGLRRPHPDFRRAGRRMKRAILDGLTQDPTKAWVRALERTGAQEILIDPFQDDSPLGLAAQAAARTDTSGEVEIDGRTWFLEVHNPPLELVLVGAVHIAQPLAAMARLAGYAVRVVDPRDAFATEARFPGVTLHREWPDAFLAKHPLSHRSALVALAHDPKIDDPALEAALASPAFYVGALGSKKTHAGRLERLSGRGFGPEDLARIHGPVGLAIGARSPAEIALSILAQMTQTLRS